MEGWNEGYNACANSTPSDELLKQWYDEGYSHGTQGNTSYGGMINNQYYSKLVDEFQRGAQVGYAEFERQMQEMMRQQELDAAGQDGYWKGAYSDTEYKQSSNPYTNDEEMAARWDSGYENGWKENSYNPESPDYITPEQRLLNAYNEGVYAGSHDYSFGDTSNPYSSETQADLHERWATGYQYGYDNA